MNGLTHFLRVSELHSKGARTAAPNMTIFFVRNRKRGVRHMFASRLWQREHTAGKKTGRCFCRRE
jgi:hypothetical protein